VSSLGDCQSPRGALRLSRVGSGAGAAWQRSA